MDIILAGLLIILGAILAFAVQNDPPGLDLDVLGWILMIVGIIGVVLIILSLTWWNRRRVVRVTEWEIAPTVVAPAVEGPSPYGPDQRTIARRQPIPVEPVAEREVSRPVERVTESPTERRVESPTEEVVEEAPSPVRGKEVPPPARDNDGKIDPIQ